MRITRTLAVAAAALLLALPTTARADEGGLIDVTPAELTIAAPAPGHSRSWTMTATNTSGAPVSLALDVVVGRGTVFEGPHPLQVELVGPDGPLQVSVVGDPGGYTSIALGDLPDGGSYRLTAVASLPEAAGNEYADATGHVRFRLVAQASESAPALPGEPNPALPGEPNPGLPKAGADVAVLGAVSVGVGAPLVLLFVFLLRRRRNHA